MTPMPEHLRQATRARTQEAEKRARTALTELVKAGKPVSFTAVARQAGVSTDFLYRSPELRTRIERHRAKGGPVPAAPADPTGDSSTSAAVRALSARLARQQQTHREEVARLRKALEVAQGENLALRRRLARYETD
ncbi:hypothetical protein ADK41_23650 [Streptomyces caelestis]|uniref:Transposase n=1 Tax=Streptomyces caelestis TaxID=36816 RepID=A0A0M8QGP2_9ACTN|nr:MULTISPECIES: DUF6262 family protein [Streptomyces]KOT35747.1 hypothetical protein ADK41_23650 [Streptomyces caelestis]KOV32816.1 hypothetical protein ADK58_05900 [Streptomyces sp. XY152]